MSEQHDVERIRFLRIELRDQVENGDEPDPEMERELNKLMKKTGFVEELAGEGLET